VVWLVAILLVLGELGFNLAPLLAGAPVSARSLATA
jgi:hypothetical protein